MMRLDIFRAMPRFKRLPNPVVWAGRDKPNEPRPQGGRPASAAGAAFARAALRFRPGSPRTSRSTGSEAARERRVHLKLRHPVVMPVRVHQHLLDAPGARILGGEDVGMAEIAGVRGSRQMRSCSV